MKKVLAILALMAIPALAQVGIIRSPSGIHVPTAKTLPQGFLFVSGNYEMVSDGKPMSIEGSYTDAEGSTIKLDKNTPSNNENIYASFGVMDNLELGMGISTHYDGTIKGANLKGLALGDLELIAKSYVPLYEWFLLGLSGELMLPTGSRDKGFRHRHRWFVRSNGETYPYTADQWVANLNGHLTIEMRDYFTFNAYIGILKNIMSGDKYPFLRQEHLIPLCDEIIAKTSECIGRSDAYIDFEKIAAAAECRHQRHWRDLGLISPATPAVYHGHPIDAKAEQLVSYVQITLDDIVLMDHEPPVECEQAELPY